MKTRMQPIGSVWNKFPRVVRDLAKICDKKVRVEMEGKGTELDKTLIEAIKDPLTHLIRNCVDHGIEAPANRVKVGKNEEGVITMRAFHEGGFVNIEINDDGGGLNLVRIKGLANPRIQLRLNVLHRDRPVAQHLDIDDLMTGQQRVRGTWRRVE